MRRKSREKTCECVSYQKEVYWTFVLRKRDEMENYERNCRWIACKNFIAPFYFVRTRIIYPWIVLPNFQINHNTIDRANQTYLLARRGCIYTSNVSYFISKIQNLFQQREREIYIYIFKEVWKEVHFSTLEIRIFVYTFILEVFFVINAVARWNMSRQNYGARWNFFIPATITCNFYPRGVVIVPFPSALTRTITHIRKTKHSRFDD